MQEEQGGIYFGVGLNTTQLQADAARVRGEIQQLGGAVEKEGNRMDTLTKRIGQGMAAAFAGTQLLGFASKIVTVRGELQQLEIAFTSMLGSKEKAEGLMAQMVNTAAHTPFDLQSVASGAKQLIAYGAEADTVNDTLVKLGDVASGIGAPLNDIVYLYGTTMSQGRLYTQDLNQFTGRGIPMIKELAKQFHVTEGGVKGLVEAGKVGFPEVQKVIESLTGTGGMFHNLMAEQSKSLSGQISNLGDSFAMMLNDIGQSHEGVFSNAIEAANYLVENYRDVAEAIGAIVASLGAYKAAVAATAAIEKARQSVRYAEEAKQLEGLLSAEQRQLVAQSGLTKGSEQYVAQLRSLAQGNAQVAQSALARAREEVKAAASAQSAARSAFARAKELEQVKRAELAAAQATGNARRIEIAQRELSAATTKRQEAAIAFKNATGRMKARQLAVQTAATQANTVAQRLNAKTTQGGVRATQILTVAKQRLMGVMNRLKAVMAANPYAIALAAVVALGYAVYKLATHQSEAEKAAAKLNETIAEAERNVASEATQVDILFNRLRNAKKGTEKYAQAREAIMRQYGDLLKSLGDEKHALDDVAKAYKLVREEAVKAAKQRAMQKAVTEQAEALGNAQTEAVNRARALLESKGFSKPDVEAVMIPIRFVIEGQEEQLSDAHRELLEKAQTRLVAYNRDVKGKILSQYSRLEEEVFRPVRETNAALNRELSLAEERFGSIMDRVKQPVASNIDTASLAELDKKIEETKGKFEELDRATGEDRNEKELANTKDFLKALEGKMRARESELAIIAQVEARIKTLQELQKNTSKDSAAFADYQQRIEALGRKLPTTKGRKGGDGGNAHSAREKERARRELEDRRLAEAARRAEAELELRAKRLEAEADGYEKQMALARLAYDRFVYQN